MYKYLKKSRLEKEADKLLRGVKKKKIKKKLRPSKKERLRRAIQRRESYLNLDKNKYKHYDPREDHLDSIQAEIKNK